MYRTPKKKVVSVRNLPRKTQVVRHNGLKYHYDNNRFYRYYGGRYVVVVPRVGLRINTLPVGHVRVAFGNRHYFWFDGIFYINVGNEYEIVQPEIATIIYELPSSYERVKIDGYTYYEYNDVLYEKVQVDGIRAYEVVGFIE